MANVLGRSVSRGSVCLSWTALNLRSSVLRLPRPRPSLFSPAGSQGRGPSRGRPGGWGGGGCRTWRLLPSPLLPQGLPPSHSPLAPVLTISPSGTGFPLWSSGLAGRTPAHAAATPEGLPRRPCPPPNVQALCSLFCDTSPPQSTRSCVPRACRSPVHPQGSICPVVGDHCHSCHPGSQL